MKKAFAILGILISLYGIFPSSVFAMSDEDFKKIFNFEINSGEPKDQNIADDGVSAVATFGWTKPSKDFDNNGTLSITDYGDWINVQGNLVKSSTNTYNNNTGVIAVLREGDATAFNANTTSKTVILKKPLTINADGVRAVIPFRFDKLTPGTQYAMTVGMYDRDGVLHLAPTVVFPTSTTGKTVKDADVGDGTSVPQQNSSNDGKIGDRCDFFDGSNGLIGCIADVMYNVVFQISGVIAWIGGKFVDIMFNYSIQSSSYNASNFINTGWGVVRDVCNLAFIFILLYAAINLIIGKENSGGIKKTIGMVIVVGVLINFSLFFTKIFIDTGNIMARVFYNSIETTIKGTDGLSRTVGKNGEKEITAALMSKIDPQKLISAEMSEELPNSYIILISLVATAVNLIAAWMFLSIGIMFVSRVVELWLKMIFSPIAFLSLALPSSAQNRIKDYGWEKWLGGLVGLAFMPAIFMFFLYLITMFVDAKSVISFSKDADIASKALSILIPFAIILGLLSAAKKSTEVAKGEISKFVSSVASTATGLAVGVASGGLSMLGRGTLGSIASNASKSQSLKDKATQKGLGGFVARTQLKAANFGSKSSFDVRKTVGGVALAKNSGINFDNKVLGSVGLDTKSGAGGFEGQAEKTKKERVKYFEDNLELKGGAIKAQDERAKLYNEELEKVLSYRNFTTTDDKDKFTAEFKKGYENGSFEDATGTKVGKGGVANANETNNQRRKEYAETLKTGSNALSSTVYEAFSRLTNDKKATRWAENMNRGTGMVPGNPTGDRRAADEITKKIGDDKKVDAEIEKVDKVLKTIENSLSSVAKGLGKDVKDLTEEDVKTHTRNQKVELDITKNKLESSKGAATRAKPGSTAATAYMALLEEKIRMEEEINELKDIFDRKEKLEEKKGTLAKKKVGDKKPDEKKDDEKK